MRLLWRLWLPWVLINMVATATGLAALWAAVHAAVSGLIPEATFALVWIPGLLWAFAGALIGVGQWLVLRQLLPRAGGWVWASALGLAVSVAVMFLAFSATGGEMEEASALDRAVVGAAGGAAVGAVQWLVLRRLVHRAGWWVLASAAGVSAAVFLYSLMSRGDVRLSVITAVGAIAGAVYGAITGSVLLTLIPRLLGQSRSTG